MRDNPLVQFLILVIAVKAGLVGLQFLGSFLPSGGPIGAVRAVLVK